MTGHGNYVCIRLKREGEIQFEVEEDDTGKNYVSARSPHRLKDGRRFHHVVAVRDDRRLCIFIDGRLSGERTGDQGIADIRGEHPMRLGHWARGTAVARISDLRVYQGVLSDAEILALSAPPPRLLRPGEVELAAPSGARALLTESNRELFDNYEALRVGPDTGATLFKDKDYQGTSQRCFADIPDVKLTQVGATPGSVLVWPVQTQPFSGGWLIKTANHRFMSWGKGYLSTAKQRDSTQLFRFQESLWPGRTLLLPFAENQGTTLRVGEEAHAEPLFVDESLGHRQLFGLTNREGNRFVAFHPRKGFFWSTEKREQTRLLRAAKLAEHHDQVGPLSTGEVALYEHPGYRGRALILSDSGLDAFGEYPDFAELGPWNNSFTSVRLGPLTGVTLYANALQPNADSNPDPDQRQDFLHSTPDFREVAIKDDTVSACRVWRRVESAAGVTSHTSVLSEDYRPAGDGLQHFSAYRTTLRLASDTQVVEVRATDQTTLEVRGVTYTVDEDTSAHLEPKFAGRIVITTPAEGLDTPGLKIRTAEMAADEWMVIYPSREVHRDLVAMPDDALWHATDAAGQALVDRSEFKQSDVATVQQTVRQLMSAVHYSDADLMHARSRKKSAQRRVVVSSNQQPVKLRFSPSLAGGSGQRVERIELDASAFKAELQSAQAHVMKGGRGLGDAIWGFFKDAVEITLGVVEDVLVAIVETVERKIRLALATVENVVSAISGLIERLVEKIAQVVEFLRFLFNWEDILATQRVLRDTWKQGVERVPVWVAAAKVAVPNYITELQAEVAQTLDSVANRLTGNQSGEPRQEKELPEALEWLLDKLFGDDEADGEWSGSDGQAGSPDPWSDILRGLSETALATLAGLGETLATLLTDPLHPERALVELLQTLKLMSQGVLEVGEDLAMLALDSAEEAMGALSAMLEAELKLGFLSRLFEQLGAGKLNLLNLTTLLIAVPATVLHKLGSGKFPAQHRGLQSFNALGDDKPSVNAYASLVASMVQSVVDAGLNMSPQAMPISEGISLSLAIFSALADLVAADPEQWEKPVNRAQRLSRSALVIDKLLLAADATQLLRPTDKGGSARMVRAHKFTAGKGSKVPALMWCCVSAVTMALTLWSMIEDEDDTSTLEIVAEVLSSAPDVLVAGLLLGPQVGLFVAVACGALGVAGAAMKLVILTEERSAVRLPA